MLWGEALGCWGSVRRWMSGRWAADYADSSMCGMWRTGRMFTYWRIGEGVKPDIVATAKALGGGYVPIAAVVSLSTPPR